MSVTFISKTPQFRTKIATVRDVLNIEAFNAMYESDPATSSSQYCGRTDLGTSFIKNVVREIKAGGAPIDINFFMEAFGTSYKSPQTTESKVIYNRYMTDLDYNVLAAAPAVGASAGARTWFTLLREQHSGGGTKSYPTTGYILVDKDNNIMYQITDMDTSTDYAHRVEIAPWDEDVIVNIKTGVKYFVSPSRPVSGYSTPSPTNDLQTIGYVQKLNPFRFRKDWSVTLDLMRGYEDIFRFMTKFDYQGKPYDAWDAYEAVRSREALQINMNAVSMFCSPITNPILLSGTYGVVTDGIHTGYYGLIPTLQSSAQVIDFDPSVGFDLQTDLEPFVLYQDSLKRCNRFSVKHGKAFKAGLVNSLNRMIKVDGQTLYNFDMYKRLGEGAVEKYGIDSYRLASLNFTLNFMELSALSDSRFLGSEKLNNMGIFIAEDGTVDLKTGAKVAPVEFFQYGMTETGDYLESIINHFKIDGTEKISGNHVQSVTMAVHSPEMHLIANPVLTC